MFAHQEAQFEQVVNVVSLLHEEELLVLVHDREWRVLHVVHVVYVETDLLADALHVLVVQVNAVPEPLDCALELNVLDLPQP